MTDIPTINFIDLALQQQRLRPALEKNISAVLDHGGYIMGPDVKQFEQELSDFCGAKHSITCANGTDALLLAIMALGIKEGDAVFVPSFTFAATAEIMPFVGATPVFVDSSNDTFNMDPESLKRAIGQAKAEALNPAAIIAVDLFGLPADIPAIENIAKRENMDLICDSAQGFGGKIDGKTTGTFGRITTTSFFPAKPLGCYGDGGAVFTDDDELAAIVRSLRVHGKGTDKYDNIRVGMNSRLDTIQAAILSVKLGVYADEIASRNKLATRYSERLGNIVTVPKVPEGYQSVWAQYTVRLPRKSDRAEIQAKLKRLGVPTAVYYPMPLHMQTAYSQYPADPDGLSVSLTMSEDVMSLPMHPYLSQEDQDYIIACVQKAVVG